MCIKRCWMMPCHDHRVLNSLFSSHQKMFITRSLRHPRGGPFASECSIFAPKTRVINSALLMYQAGATEPRAHHHLGWPVCARVLNFAPMTRVINSALLMYQAEEAEPRAHQTLGWPLCTSAQFLPNKPKTVSPPCLHPVPTCDHPVTTPCPTFAHPVPILCPLGLKGLLRCEGPKPLPLKLMDLPIFNAFRRPCQVLSIYQRSENSSMTLSEYNLIHVVHETIKLLKYLRKKIAHVSS